jgi:hypothetical protein
MVCCPRPRWQAESTIKDADDRAEVGVNESNAQVPKGWVVRRFFYLTMWVFEVNRATRVRGGLEAGGDSDPGLRDRLPSVVLDCSASRGQRRLRTALARSCAFLDHGCPRTRELTGGCYAWYSR